ncbi:MAG TPA: hypothetical protein VMP67_03410 [Candidatus Limnocylindria bacterium]|nr:hypothetical protein [Candidatus Limnocylindria bacterium]
MTDEGRATDPLPDDPRLAGLGAADSHGLSEINRAAGGLADRLLGRATGNV